MKILITTDWYRPVINGVVTSVLNLTEQLEKRGHEVKVLTLSRNCHSYKEENVIYAGSVGMGKIERILEGYRVSCPVSVVPSGIDTEKYRRRIDDGSREALRERYGIKKEEIVFVYVGRIAKEKNIEELLWYQKKCTKQYKTCLSRRRAI